MAVATLAFELAGAFLLAAGMLWKYGNLKKSTPGVVLGPVLSNYPQNSVFSRLKVVKNGEFLKILANFFVNF